MTTHSFHLMDTKGKYQGSRCVTDEEAAKLEESGFHLIPVGNGHLAMGTVMKIVQENHSRSAG